MVRSIRFHRMSLPRYGLAIPACNGGSRHGVLPIEVEVASGMQSSGTGPTSRQLQDKVGGVTPAGLFLWGKLYLAAVRRLDRSRCSSCQSVQHGPVQGIV